MSQKAPKKRGSARESRHRKGLVVSLPTLHTLDRRTRATRCVFELRDRLAADLGGFDALSTMEQQLIDRAALVGAQLEAMTAEWLRGNPLDVASFSTLSNVERRALAQLGLKKRMKNVTPHDRLRQYASVASQAAPA